MGVRDEKRYVNWWRNRDKDKEIRIRSLADGVGRGG